MLQLKVILQAAILLTATVFVQSTLSQNTTFHLQLVRNQRSINIITLTCRNDDVVDEPDAAAVFYLNGSQLSPENYPSFSNQDSQAGVVTFQINRQLEGKYTCGVGETKSSPISLIAYPTGDASIIRPARENTYYAVAGDTAVLECAVAPGALIHYYHVTWLNGSRAIIRQSLPSQRNSTFPDSVDPRYRLDPMNLSLIIDDVRRSDSIQDYRCYLRVVDPRSRNTLSYTVASNVNISLTVLSPPVITTLRTLQGTVRQLDNAIFSCKAEGYPLPTISWMHNGRIVTIQDHHPDYLVSPNNEGSDTVISDLRIFSASVDKTGDVTCIASADMPEDSSITLANHNASTFLTVLGTFKQFDVLISKGGDVIFLLELPAVYNQSVNLFIEYTDDHNSSRSYNRTTEIGFLNSKSIQYVEYSSQVSYDRFQVKAGLVSGGTLGPLTAAPGVYDKDSATLCDDDGFDLHHALVLGVTPAGFLFLVCIVLTIVICVLVCIIALKKDPHTPKLIEYIVKNAKHDTRMQPGRLSRQITDQDQFPAGDDNAVIHAGPPLSSTNDVGVASAASSTSGAPSPEQQPKKKESRQSDNDSSDPVQLKTLNQQRSQTSQSQAADSVTGASVQRSSSIGTEHGVTETSPAGNPGRSPQTHYQHTRGGGTDYVDSGVPAGEARLTQQQSVLRQQSGLSSNIRSLPTGPAHKDNPVYYLVKKSMIEAKFPRRKYKRLKEKLRSTCEECKKDQ